MKEMIINIVKKNRVYFKCVTDKNFEFKLKIDDLSKDLEPGKHALLVNDISVRTKYGTDIIYEMACEKEDDEESNKFTTLKHHMYNSKLVKKCQDLAGIWDGDSKTWVFKSVVEELIEDLDYHYNSDLVDVELTAIIPVRGEQSCIDFQGYTIVKGYGRDSGANLPDDIIMTSGVISTGGSMKNWLTKCSEGSKFIIKVSKNIINDYENMVKEYSSRNSDYEREWSIRII